MKLTNKIKQEICTNVRLAEKYHTSLDLEWYIKQGYVFEVGNQYAVDINKITDISVKFNEFQELVNIATTTNNDKLTVIFKN